MLTPVPGLSHIHVLRADATTLLSPPAKPVMRPSAIPPPSGHAPTILKALQAAFGMREVTTLPPNRFSKTVRTQISARLRMSSARGPVSLITLHGQYADHDRIKTELFGTALGAGKIVGFTAVAEGRRLVSFRII